MLFSRLVRWMSPFVIAALLAMPAVCPASAVDTSYPATPQGVVEAFCRAYAEGQGLSSSSAGKNLQYTTWTDTPGWDSAVVIRSYHITSFKNIGAVTEVDVKFHKVGTLESGESHYEFKAMEESEDKTFRVVKTEGKWKITKPLLPPHIGLDTAIKLLQFELSSMTVTEAEKTKADISALKSIRGPKH